MVVVNFQDQIQPGTFEYALHFLIEEKLDLSVFNSEYKNDDNGRLDGSCSALYITLKSYRTLVV